MRLDEIRLDTHPGFTVNGGIVVQQKADDVLATPFASDMQRSYGVLRRTNSFSYSFSSKAVN